MFSYEICEICEALALKNICERLLLFVSPQNTATNSGGETSTECSVNIFLNVTIFFNQMLPYKSFFNISINILIKFLTLHAF